jgi:hypothetical protein
MDKVITWFQTNWVQITVVGLAVSKILTVVRDAIDKTPNTDDNWFERTVTIINKVAAQLLTGKRPEETKK